MASSTIMFGAIIAKPYPALIILLWCVVLSPISQSMAQNTVNALFLGNSYTGSNNLPQLVHNVALSAGDTLMYDSNTPGGHRLLGHASNATSQNLIAAGGWDYVVIQGQSQEPIMFPGDFNNGAVALYGQVKQANPCAVVMPFVTWGRENGDAALCASFPTMCTYESMDSVLMLRYLEIAEGVSAEVSPVSAVWRYIRDSHPGIDLYTSDGSHPSGTGSYAAACCFYAAIFKKNPELITVDLGVDPVEAQQIRTAAKLVVFDQLATWDFKRAPRAEIRLDPGPNPLDMYFISYNPGGIVQDVLWEFGDGNTSTAVHPLHTYGSNGTYTVQLTATTCDAQGWHTAVADTTIHFCGHTPSVFTTHPWLCRYDTLWTEPADAYQWYAGNTAISGATGPYLADYGQYNTAGQFSVLATSSGCAELSDGYNPTPVPYIYDLDVLGGDPCAGDTAMLIIDQFTGILHGNESIQWYRNDTLLTMNTDEDTLLITQGGAYLVHIIDPTSDCPSDTMTYTMAYDCLGTGILESNTSSALSIYPNPTDDLVFITVPTELLGHHLSIHASDGRLIRTQRLTSEVTRIIINDLEKGLYLIRYGPDPRGVQKLIKR